MHLSRILSIIFAALCLVGIALPVLGQEKASPGIPGFLAPQTGSFKPAVAPPAADAGVPITRHAGRITFELTIGVESTLPRHATINCLISTGVDDTGTGGTGLAYSGYANVEATGSGFTRTCTAVIPYSWNLGSTADVIFFSYYVQLITPATSTLPEEVVRQTYQTLTSVPVPAGTSAAVRVEGTSEL